MNLKLINLLKLLRIIYGCLILIMAFIFFKESIRKNDGLEMMFVYPWKLFGILHLISTSGFIFYSKFTIRVRRLILVYVLCLTLSFMFLFSGLFSDFFDIFQIKISALIERSFYIFLFSTLLSHLLAVICSIIILVDVIDMVKKLIQNKK